MPVMQHADERMFYIEIRAILRLRFDGNGAFIDGHVTPIYCDGIYFKCPPGPCQPDLQELHDGLGHPLIGRHGMFLRAL